MAVWRDAIRAMLRERGMTQQELARLAGISRSTVCTCRRRTLRHRTLDRMPVALDVDVAELFSGAVD